jgi:hypothetical protein
MDGKKRLVMLVNFSQLMNARLELRMLGSFGVGDALIFQPGIQLGEASLPAAWVGTFGRADCRPGSRPDLSPTQRRGCRPPVRSDGASTSAESDDYNGAPCRRRSLRPPSSCCRRCRAGRPRHRTGTLRLCILGHIIERVHQHVGIVGRRPDRQNSRRLMSNSSTPLGGGRLLHCVGLLPNGARRQWATLFRYAKV